ncbi:double-stranded RNA binding motif-containing protein [Klosneuvirus KNV1]|uniref:Double-stranded RNA binding motif-containing protein n=1 Tax=Klosneuvirus KNV1 TaxID=1977640 RepID=A0A1V0SKW3_9VIRU|nr:double-stranded RNA binding motif-containing protein [Klosneuvirus KNV1]
MEKSYKNLLQEHFQKNNLPLPYYETNRIDGLDHEPVWRAQLELDDTLYESEGSSKKEAEIKVAEQAYLDYCQKPVKQEIKLDRKQKVKELRDIDFSQHDSIIMVDGENCDIDMGKINANMLVLFFAAKNTTKNKIFEYQSKYDHCYVFLSQCVGKDAADHLLTFYAGKLSMISNKKMYVLTKDHYGEFLERFMDNCKFICSLDEIN